MLHDFNIKKLISVFAVIVLVLTVCFNNGLLKYSTAVAADALPKATHTFSNFGLLDGNYSANNTDNAFSGDISELLDGGVLKEKIKVEKIGTGNYFIVLFAASGKSWEGLQMQITKAGRLQISLGGSGLYDSSRTFYMHMDPKDAGLNSFIGEEFEIGLVFSKADVDKNGSNDLQIKFYINGVQFQKTNSSWTAFQNGVYTIPGGYDKIVNATGSTNKYLCIYPQGGNAVIHSEGIAVEQDEIPDATHSFSDFGLLNGNYSMDNTDNAFSGDISELLDGGVLKEKIKVEKTGTGNYFIVLFAASGKSWEGLQMQITKAGRLQISLGGSGLYDSSRTFYMHMDPKDAGLNSFIGEEFEIGLVFSKADVDKNGSNDLQIKFYINGVHFKKTNSSWTAFQNGVYTIPGGYDKIVNAAGSTNKYLCIYPQGGNAAIQSEIEPAGPEEISAAMYSFSDFGVVGNCTTNSAYAYSGDISKMLDGGVLKERIKINRGSSGNYFMIMFAENAKSWSGLQMQVTNVGRLQISASGNITDNSNYTYYMHINPSDVGLNSFDGEEFELALMFSKADVDKNGSNDLQIKIYINGYQCKKSDSAWTAFKDGVYTLYGGYDKIVNSSGYDNKYLCLYPTGGAGEFYSADEREIEEVSNDYKKLTLSDAGIGDGSGNASGRFLAIDSLDKTLFSANLKFSKNSSRIHYGMSDSTDGKFVGVGIRLSGDCLVLGNEVSDSEGALSSIDSSYRKIDPKFAGVGDTFIEKDFLLQLSTEFVDLYGSGSKDDIKLGVYINGKLYLNRYIYIIGQASLFGKRININEGGADFSSYEKYFEELALSDFGIADGTYSKNKYYEYDLSTYDGTVLNADVLFANKNSFIKMGGRDSYIMLVPDSNNNLEIKHSNEGKLKTVGVISSKTAGSNLVGSKLRLRVKFDFADLNADKTDLVLGIYINGKLYNYDYFVIKDVDVASIIRAVAFGGGITLSSPKYLETTLRDYSIKDGSVVNQEVYGYYDGEMMDYTAVSGIFNFSSEKAGSNAVYFGGKRWTGFRIDVSSNGKLFIKHLDSKGMQTPVAVAQPSDFGLDTFLDKDLEIKFTVKTVQEIREYYYCILGFYVNGKMLNNKYIVYKNAEEITLSRNLFVFAPKGGKVTVKSKDSKVRFSIWGFDNNWTKTLGLA